MAWRNGWRGGLVALALLAGSNAAWAGTVNLANGVAISGYDPVAYFTQNKAVPGDPAITATHAGATYRFASAEDRDLFTADPAKYAPEFGGFCAYGAAQGQKAPIDPEAFTIVDGRLYLNYDRDVWATFQQDTAGYIGKAEANWPEVQQQADPTN